MALLDNAWYINYGNGSSTGYYAVTPWVTLTGAVAGAIWRQATVSPALTERCFVCYNSTAGTGVSGAAEPTWGTSTRGQQYTDGTLKWEECTGVAGLNGDNTNTPTWSQLKTFSGTATLGQVIKNAVGTLILLCTVGGVMGASEPSWSAYTTTGATTIDNGATWVTLGSNAKYSIWNAPSARLAVVYAANWGQAGNAFFVSSIHAETQSASLTLTGPGTVTNPILVYCVKNAPATTPPGSGDLASTATVTTTVAANLTFGNASYYYNGIGFFCGSGANVTTINQTGPFSKFENCSFNIPGTSSGSVIAAGGGNAIYNEWINTTVSFGSIGGALKIGQGGIWHWLSTVSAITGATIPTLLIIGANGSAQNLLRGIDLSALTTQFYNSNATNAYMLLQDCKLNSGLTPTSVTGSASLIDIIRSDSAGTNYQQQRYGFAGNLTTELTIVRTGGAQVTGIGVSWNITTLTNIFYEQPFNSFLMAIQNTTTGSNVTLTVYGIWKTAALPNNDQIWIEADYLGASTSPLGTYINDTKANNLAAGTALTADSTSAWGAGAAAYQTSHAYGAFTGVILAGNASPQQLWFMSSHSGSGTSGSSTTIFNGQADGAQVTDNAGANQIVWQAMTRWSMSVTMSSPQPAQQGQINVKVRAALASATFYVDPQPVL